MGWNTRTAEKSLHMVVIPPSSVTDNFAIQCLLLASGFQHHEDAFGKEATHWSQINLLRDE